MNGDASANFARALAKRVANDAGQSPQSLVERAFRLTLGRTPTQAEAARSQAFLAKNNSLDDLCLSLLSTSEFLYID
jgi:hypothetical protein